MSELLQPGKYLEGQHPDADQLNAFVEQSLPAHERQKTLVHLASCAACRDIVALSLPPMEQAPAAEAEPVFKPWFRGWSTGWKLGWVAVPALAALVILVVHLRNVPTGETPTVSNSQIADSRTPLPPAPPQVLPEPSKTLPGLRARPSKPASRAMKPKATGEPSNAAPDERGRSVAALKRPPSLAAQPAPGPAVLSGTMSGMGSGMSAAPTAKPSGAVMGFVQQPPRAAAPASQSASAGQPSPTPTITVSTGASTATPTSIDSTAFDVAAQDSVAPLPVAGREVTRPAANFAIRKSGYSSAQAPLPSGLEILSLAANLHQRLAIDIRNQLFFSEDDGLHWKAISPSWKGRATTVAAVTPLPPHPEALTLAVPDRFTTQATASAGPSYPGSSLSGTVTDATGAVVPGVTVVATDSRTALTRTVLTDGAGRYLVEELPPGVYRIEARSPGFLKQSQTAALSTSQQTVTNIVLAVGASTQTVTVETSSAQIDTVSRNKLGAMAKAKKPDVRSPASQTSKPAIFAIATDTGERWTSPDGQTWKHE